METAFLSDLTGYRQKLRIKLLRAVTNANKKAIKIVRARNALEAELLSSKSIIPETGDSSLLSAFKKAVESGEDPGKAVADAAP